MPCGHMATRPPNVFKNAACSMHEMHTGFSMDTWTMYLIFACVRARFNFLITLCVMYFRAIIIGFASARRLCKLSERDWCIAAYKET